MITTPLNALKTNQTQEHVNKTYSCGFNFRKTTHNKNKSFIYNYSVNKSNPSTHELKELETHFIKFIESVIENQKNDYDWAQILNSINVDEIPGYGLIILLTFLEKKQNSVSCDYWKHASYRRICFELKNAIFCRAWNNALNEKELIDHSHQFGLTSLGNQLQGISQKTETLSIKGTNINKNDESSKVFKEAALESLTENITLDISIEKPRVLVASLEYIGSKVGGVGTVATELLYSMNKEGQDARIITPLYNTYVSDYYDTLKFVGVINHPFHGEWIQSTIYSVITQGNVIQYFVKPPKSILKINDIGESNNVYATTHETSFVNRTQYLTSASTAFAASYIGDDKKTPFQVLHTNSWILSFAGELLTKHYNPMREKAGLGRLAHVAYVHGTGNTEQGRGLSPSIFDSLGLKRPAGLNHAKVNMQAHAYGSSSDCDIHVSNWSMESSMTKKEGYKLQELVKEKHKLGRLFGVRNGIARDSYDPTSKAVYGDFAFKQSFKDGIDITDYTSQRQQVKQKLYDEKLISSPLKPLFLYVGRFDVASKGVDVLPSMVKQIHSEGGQCVVMGVSMGDKKADKIVKTLQKLQKKYPDTLKVFTDLKKDQLEKIQGTTIQKGKLIRLASDFVIVSSHKETDGLVPKEALTTGTLLISSNVQGLTDTTRGLGDLYKGKKITLEDFNGFTYKNNLLFKKNGKESIKIAMKFFRSNDTQNKNRFIARMIEESKIFDWKNAILKINQVYKIAMEEKTESECSALKKCEAKFYKRNFSLKAIAMTVLRRIRNLLQQIFKKNRSQKI